MCYRRKKLGDCFAWAKIRTSVWVQTIFSNEARGLTPTFIQHMHEYEQSQDNTSSRLSLLLAMSVSVAKASLIETSALAHKPEALARANSNANPRLWIQVRHAAHSVRRNDRQHLPVDQRSQDELDSVWASAESYRTPCCGSPEPHIVFFRRQHSLPDYERVSRFNARFNPPRLIRSR